MDYFAFLKTNNLWVKYMCICVCVCVYFKNYASNSKVYEVKNEVPSLIMPCGTLFLSSTYFRIIDLS